VFEKMKFSRNDEAVSEVIGVILTVAVTVTLAAIVAAFVFGMPGQVKESKHVSASAQKIDADEVMVTFTGGEDAQYVETVSWKVTTGGGEDASYKMGTVGSILPVGTSHRFTAATLGGYRVQTHAVAAAHFSDGSDQVILDIWI
jgi:flagellin-like protein